MDYYDEYDRDLMEYENELYKDPEEEESDEIDSEIEDKLLSAIHYSSDLINSNQQKTTTPQPKQSTQNERGSNTSLQSSNQNLEEKENIVKNNINKSNDNKIQKPDIINSANIIPASIYNEAKSQTISKSDLSNIYNLDVEEDNSDNENGNIKNINSDSDSEDNSKFAAKKLNNNTNNIDNNSIDKNISNENEDDIEIFEDLTNQPLNNINVITTDNSNEVVTIPEETNEGSEEEYITHVIIPNNFDNEKSETTPVTATTENYDEDTDNKKGTSRYFAPQSKKEVVCYFCRQTGHLSIDCDQKKTLCPICEENHDPLKCPYSNACLKCACIGHQSRDCPNLWQKQDCKFCYEVHNTVECPYLWRRYSLNVHASKYKSSVKRFCYNCGMEGHFGDECEERRYNRAFKVSAQSIKNEDPVPITNEELEAWHFDKDKQNGYSSKKKHNNKRKHNNNNNNNSNHNYNYNDDYYDNYNSDHSSKRNRNKNNDDYYDNYNSDHGSKRNRNKKRSRNQDYDSDYDDYSYKKYDHKQNKSNHSGNRGSDKFNYNNFKSSKNNRNNNYNNGNNYNNNNNNYNNNNYENKNKKRKSNYSFSSTKPSIRSRLS